MKGESGVGRAEKKVKKKGGGVNGVGGGGRGNEGGGEWGGGENGSMGGWTKGTGGGGGMWFRNEGRWVQEMKS